MKNQPVIVICGPTATGKTDIGIRISGELQGNIISADSRQLYKHMDIGTGKDIGKDAVFHLSDLHGTSRNTTLGYYEVNKIPLWLYDIIPPDRTFSAYEYAELGRLTINHLVKRNIVPVIVGGSGLYIRSLIDGIDNPSSADWEQRKFMNTLPVSELQQILISTNPNCLQTMNNSDRNNPRRLIRAIEKEKLHTQTTGHFENNSITNPVIYIGLTCSRIELYKRIDMRVEKRLQEGIIEEIRSLLKRGYSWNDPGLTTVGYAEWKPFIEGHASSESVVEVWKTHEKQYAKRQMTWFNKDKRIIWFDIAKHSSDDIAQKIVTLYNESLTL